MAFYSKGTHAPCIVENSAAQIYTSANPKGGASLLILAMPYMAIVGQLSISQLGIACALM